MATMASTSHGLSVWANNCVKTPINTKTGLKTTMHDKRNGKLRFDESNNEIHNFSLSPTGCINDPEKLGFQGSGSGDIGDESRFSSVDTSDHLDFLKGDSFYEKLKQLKEENKQTLEAYKRIYQEKLILEDIRGDYYSDEYENDFSVNGTNKPIMGKDNKGIILSKPPIPKTRSNFSDEPVLSKSLTLTSQYKKDRPNSAPLDRKFSTLSSDELQMFFENSKEEKDSNFIITKSNKYDEALAKVDKLWEDFNISEYSNRRHSISSMQDKDREKNVAKKEWRHRITIPQPFRMTVRDSVKEKKKTSAQMELERRRLEKQKEEEAECEKKFKAQPVPSHVYLPKYEEIMEKNESRRKYVKQYCQELLQSQVKPFNFEIREQEKKRQSHSAPLLKTDKPKPVFKAKPVPQHIFSPEIDEKLMAEEELRKIRVKMRSKELLNEASLPPNMAAREKLKEQARVEKARQAKLAKKKQRLRRSHSVPNYDLLYNEFQNELSKRKSVREGTVIKPFDLKTELIQSNRERIQQDIQADENKLKENRWPYLSSRTTPRSSMKYLGALSSSLDSIPTHSSKAADLRTVLVKKKQERINHRIREEEESERRRKAREAKLRRFLSEKMSDDLPKPRDSIAERLRKHRIEDRTRQEAYQNEIEEMKNRVEQSPLLVDKYLAENAKRQADKKFTATLKKAGLDKEMISTRSFGHTSVKSNFNSDEFDDAGDSGRSPNHTYIKSNADDSI
ncbi:protein FAM161A-like [Physella acuta]|uniref:protein FAM161A-like n=1 Tax=Physella acuta TaxID=109671 RepID=UPI0027DAF126|nr:protein FAM161A-like [Physella acuta]